MAGGEGFEPPQAASKAAVLPLNDPPVEPRPGVEPGVEGLQSSALPIGLRGDD